MYHASQQFGKKSRLGTSLARGNSRSRYVLSYCQGNPQHVEIEKQFGGLEGAHEPPVMNTGAPCSPPLNLVKSQPCVFRDQCLTGWGPVGTVEPHCESVTDLRTFRSIRQPRLVHAVGRCSQGRSQLAWKPVFYSRWEPYEPRDLFHPASSLPPTSQYNYLFHHCSTTLSSV